MNPRQTTPVLLALDAGVRESGWAMFGPEDAMATGVVGTPARRRMDAQTRVSQLVQCLGLLVEQWRPGSVAHILPSGIHWAMPALELLNAGLVQWSQRYGLRLYPYTAQEVRAAIAGHANASRDQLAYGVMLRLGLIGQSKTTHEWEALAVGHYHLSRLADGGLPAIN